VNIPNRNVGPYDTELGRNFACGCDADEPSTAVADNDIDSEWSGTPETEQQLSDDEDACRKKLRLH